ncbi:MAG: hypothetical protein MJ134_07370 [Lachnospiraceae bacterium]|nr:hypothetical protein [Lachnospiraceae bacterium]
MSDLMAPVTDGQFQANKVEKTEKEKKNSNSALDKDAFLQLLVAQMKYQDPLEPTSNTEYISQLATFSQLEEMQNMSASMNLQRASSLVGQYAYMAVKDSNGNTTYPEGQVDFVKYENNKAYLSIGGELYPLDSLQSVADSNYVLATKLADTFAKELNKLPKASNISPEDLPAVATVLNAFDSMSDYQRGFLTEAELTAYKEYSARYDEMVTKPVTSFLSNLLSLPKAEELKNEDAPEVEKVMEEYEALTAYQKDVVPTEAKNRYDEIVKKYNEVTTA